MKATFTFFFVPLALFLSTATALDSTPLPFRLRAWNSFNRFPPTVPPPGPIFNHWAELDPSTGDVIINATSPWYGFDSYLDPRPEGTLHTLDNSNWGYLLPLQGADNSTGDNDSTKRFVGHFALRYGPGLPKIGNLLFTNFTTRGRDCGGNCGGSTLDYDEGEGTRGFGTWYVEPRGDGKDGVWNLRWTNVEEGQVVPSGGWAVYLWKN